MFIFATLGVVAGLVLATGTYYLNKHNDEQGEINKVKLVGFLNGVTELVKER